MALDACRDSAVPFDGTNTLTFVRRPAWNEHN